MKLFTLIIMICTITISCGVDQSNSDSQLNIPVGLKSMWKGSSSKYYFVCPGVGGYLPNGYYYRRNAGDCGSLQGAGRAGVSAFEAKKISSRARQLCSYGRDLEIPQGWHKVTDGMKIICGSGSYINIRKNGCSVQNNRVVCDDGCRVPLRFVSVPGRCKK